MLLISVIIPSYNHGKFICQAIESVLVQKDVNLELLIADDGSSDDTISILDKYESNPQVTVFDNKINQGAGIVTEQLIRHAKGKYIALLNSDDFWSDPYKLKKQISFLESNPSFGACFGKANFVDENGNKINKFAMEFGDVFDKGKNRSRGEWLRYFLDHGNCICHPTMLIKKQSFYELGVYKNSLRQLPDYEMWVSLVKNYDIHIFDEEFVNFRILPGENASANSESNSIRIFNEQYLVTRNYFEGISENVLLEGFKDLLRHPNKLIDRRFIECETALILLNYHNQWLGSVYKQVAIENLYNLLNKPQTRQILQDFYDFGDRDFHRVLGEHDILRPNFVRTNEKLGKPTRIKVFLSSVKRKLLNVRTSK
ncbi:glycosyltransferase [Vibrio toranzoniae]|uniref:glycosyltransferase n=1 Tax=Vibrio toranzoniae TaxID=1194427 RepID=UPI001376AB3B|nr:glycosyltransferase [Vibrio toranzoniae]NAZ91664.1 glycosyltransferase [Vibrio toranzoniae]